MLLELLTWDRHCSKHLISTNSFNLQTHLITMKYVLLLFLTNSEVMEVMRSSRLAQDPHLVSGSAGLQTQALSLLGPLSFLSFSFFFFLQFIYFISLFLAAVGLCCRTWAFFNCGQRGLFLVGQHRLQGAQAQYLWLMGSRMHGLQELQHMGSLVGALRFQRAQAQQLWYVGLVARWPGGSSQTRD